MSLPSPILHALYTQQPHAHARRQPGRQAAKLTIPQQEPTWAWSPPGAACLREPQFPRLENEDKAALTSSKD